MKPQSPTRFLDPRIRVAHGLERERQIAEALRKQAGLPIVDSTGYEDKDRKVDRWINYPDGRIALQIKYRETGEDLLFEVFDRFNGWDATGNKVGRDMVGDAAEYAVLMQDRSTIVMVPTELAKKVVNTMVDAARTHGWTVMGPFGGTFKYFANGVKLELKVQRDPGDGRSKMVAYIPAQYFIAESQAKVYEVRLPKEWKKAA